MRDLLKNTIRPVVRRAGFDIVRYSTFPPDFTAENREICELVSPYTMTTVERLNALIDGVRYVVDRNIQGAFVECGVWKGGSSMAIAHALKQLRCDDRELYLYDTFEGMSAPTEVDVSYSGWAAAEKFQDTKTSEDSSDWCASSLDEVKKNLFDTGYVQEKMHFVKGKIEDTIPESAPDKIALLRLDTDWYESTKHELVHLFPRLQDNGVLIIDDYGHWQGARKAVDEYLAEKNIQILLNRIDYSARIAIKSA